jgi:hypothetical protein
MNLKMLMEKEKRNIIMNEFTIVFKANICILYFAFVVLNK